MATYDDVESKDILARAAGRLLPHKQAKHTESGELLKALVTLSGTGGFQIAVKDGSVEVQVGSRLASVHYGVNEGHFIIVGRGGNAFPVAMRFNPVLNRFEGDTHDAYRNPQPGLPTPPRDALAVLVDAICRVLET